ncbi:unnamed protein product [Callosobruchus maculatus]|uniref:Uncharacterized protein n=1 Tax=Callosobruchus maculatus TaxID=64391 RepID=A0A653BVN0_CALMS|nr:unnamed protein product [Callosobruchus maculatus]
MIMAITSSLHIVNGAMLAAYANKKVSILGFVTEQAPNGLWFDIKTTDNQVVRITLKKPLDKKLEGYVEAHGTSSGKGVAADDYIPFTNEDFDATMYNKLCKYLIVPNLL